MVIITDIASSSRGVRQLSLWLSQREENCLELFIQTVIHLTAKVLTFKRKFW